MADETKDNEETHPSEYQATVIPTDSAKKEGSSKDPGSDKSASNAPANDHDLHDHTFDHHDDTLLADTDAEHKEPEVEPAEPVCRNLGDTEISLSELSLGTWGLGDKAYGPVSESLFENTINAAFESGVTTFDVAPLWGRGWAEEVVGRTLSERVDETQIITRCGIRYQGDALEHSFSAEDIKKDCERSLQRLGREQIDVLLMHEPPMEMFEREDWVTALEELVTEGKIRAWGASCSSKDQCVAALTAGAKAVCILHNLLHHSLLPELTTDIADAGAGVLVRSPLMHGLLAGRWPGSRRFAPDDHRSERWTTAAMRIRVRQINKLRYLVHDEVINLTSAGLRFALGSEHVASVLVGSRQPYQIKEAARVAGADEYLPKADIDKLSEALSAS